LRDRLCRLVARFPVLAALTRGGQVALEGSKLPAAERAFRAALALEPEQPDALHGLGMVALKARKAKAAQQLLGRALLAARKRRAPPAALAVALAHYGQALRQLGEPAKAAAAYRESLKLAANDQVARWLTEVEGLKQDPRA